MSRRARKQLISGVLGGANIPSWVATDFLGRRAILDANYSGGQFYWNHATYADETALNTALGASKSGVARTVTPYVFGSELITNGTFDTDVSSWAAMANHGAISWDSGNLLLAGNSQSVPQALQAVTVTPGKGYAFSAQGWLTVGGGACATRILNGNTIGAAVLGGPSAVTNNTTTPTTLIAYLGANTTTVYADLYNGQASGTNTYRFDNATFKECLPFNGLTAGQIGVKISATAPASTASTIVLWQAGGNERDRARLELQSDMSLHFKVTYNNVSQADINLGTLTGSTAFVVEAQAGVDTFSAALDGGTRQFAAVGSMPGLAQTWIGRSFTGETWTGTIERVSFFNQAHAAAPYFVAYGDSLTNNDRSGEWKANLAASMIPPRRVVNKGVGGNGINHIRDRFVDSDPSIGVVGAGGWDDPDTIYSIEGGYNNGTDAASRVAPDLATMIALIPDRKYIIWNIPNGSAAGNESGGAIYNVFVSVNAATKATYPGRVVEIREALVAAYNPLDAQDVIDHGNDISPSSLREDTIHFNAAGGAVWRATAKALLDALGWSVYPLK
jgi:hypothetical protein